MGQGHNVTMTPRWCCVVTISAAISAVFVYQLVYACALGYVLSGGQILSDPWTQGPGGAPIWGPTEGWRRDHTEHMPKQVRAGPH